jgi:hypothetical protein
MVEVEVGTDIRRRVYLDAVEEVVQAETEEG